MGKSKEEGREGREEEEGKQERRRKEKRVEREGGGKEGVIKVRKGRKAGRGFESKRAEILRGVQL